MKNNHNIMMIFHINQYKLNLYILIMKIIFIIKDIIKINIIVHIQ